MASSRRTPPPEPRALVYPHEFLDRPSVESVITLRSSSLLLDGGKVISPLQAEAWYKFPADHPCFDGHWPGHHTVPNHLWQEMVGQAASLLLVHLDESRVPELVPTFRSVAARFYGNVYPTDTVHVTAELVRQPSWTAGGTVTGKVVGQVHSHRYQKPVAVVSIGFIALPRNSLVYPAA